jgi:MerR family transcriptional regulator, light-induced transcriptional regulator
VSANRLEGNHPVADPGDSPERQAGYGIGALASRLGVAPATLRDWERRYGLGPGGRSAGGHRRYQPEDIARIEHMRRLVLDGMPPSEAARMALAPPPAAEPATQEPPDLAAWGAGGRSLRLAGQQPRVRGLARAALALDARAIATVLERSLDASGVVATWERLAVPVLTAVGERSAADGSCVDAEHLLSAQLIGAFAARAGRLAEPGSARSVLLACADNEQHSLPLYAMAAALAERGVRTTMLGARTPPAVLAGAIARTGPAAAFVWSQTAETGDPAQLHGIPGQRPPLRLFAVGPGWREVPHGVRTVSSLPEAVQQGCEAVGLA